LVRQDVAGVVIDGPRMKDCVEVVNVVVTCMAPIAHVVLLSPFVSDGKNIRKAVPAVKIYRAEFL
jgi:hypothetical protein